MALMVHGRLNRCEFSDLTRTSKEVTLMEPDGAHGTPNLRHEMFQQIGKSVPSRNIVSLLFAASVPSVPSAPSKIPVILCAMSELAVKKPPNPYSCNVSASPKGFRKFKLCVV